MLLRNGRYVPFLLLHVGLVVTAYPTLPSLSMPILMALAAVSSWALE